MCEQTESVKTPLFKKNDYYFCQPLGVLLTWIAMLLIPENQTAIASIISVAVFVLAFGLAWLIYRFALLFDETLWKKR